MRTAPSFSGGLLLAISLAVALLQLAVAQDPLDLDTLTGVGTSFDSPGHVIFGGAGGLYYVADTKHNRIAKYFASNNSFVHMAGDSGFTSGTAASPIGASAFMNRPVGMSLDIAAGNLYVADSQNSCLRSVSLKWPYAVANLAGSCGAANNFANSAPGASALTARFAHPVHLAFDAVRRRVYVADSFNNCIRLVGWSEVTGGAYVMTYAGVCTTTSDATGYPDGAVAPSDGLRLAAVFERPTSLALTTNRTVLYVGQYNATADKSSIRVVTATNVWTVALIGSIRLTALVGLAVFDWSGAGLFESDVIAMCLDATFKVRRVDVVNGSVSENPLIVSSSMNSVAMGPDQTFAIAVLELSTDGLQRTKTTGLFRSTNDWRLAIQNRSTRSASATPSRSDPSASVTRSHATMSTSRSRSFSASVSGPTPTPGSPSKSDSLTSSATGSPSGNSPSLSASASASVSFASSTITPSRTTNPTRTRSIVPSDTTSATASGPSSSTTLTSSPSVSATATPSGGSLSLTATPSVSPSSSASNSASFASGSLSASGTGSRTSLTYFVPPTHTGRLTVTKSKVETPSDSVSSSRSRDSPSTSVTCSQSPTSSASLSPSLSRTAATATGSATDATMSQSATITPPPTSTPSSSASYSFTRSLSASTSISQSTTSSHSTSASPSWGTLSVSTIPSKTPTGALTRTRSALISDTMSRQRTITDPLTWTKSEELTASTDVTESFTLRLTTSKLPPTTTPVPTHTMTFNTQCTPCQNGVCSDTYPPFCICFKDQTRGYWDGDDLPRGGACDRCRAGVFGLRCEKPCPGGFCSPCNGHGLCHDGTTGNGTCSCYRSEATGHWSGQACSDCAPSYYGPTCGWRCDCSSHGTCKVIDGAVICVCAVGWGGRSCDECAADYYGPQCSTCPSLQGRVCGGQGRCSEGLSGTGECFCFYPFTGALCQEQCPTCECTLRTKCLLCAPQQNPCNGHGRCTVTAACACDVGFAGTTCDVSCARNATGNICSGHGSCAADGTCACHSSNATGYFAGPTCAACMSPYSPPHCVLRCPTNDANETCSRQGTCFEGVCACEVGSCGPACQFSGAFCDPCPAAAGGIPQYGPTCQFQCQCTRGACRSGRVGDGSCQCPPGFVGPTCAVECAGTAATPCSSRGTCLAPLGVCACQQGAAMAACNATCPGQVSTADGRAVFCTGHGFCDDGRLGTGNCRCEPTWAPPNCAVCADRFSGVNCTIPCQNGNTSGKLCICNPFYGGAGCSRRCAASFENGTVCSGHGTCEEGESGTGRCLCAAPYKGPACNCTDIDCLTETPNSQCNAATGECECDIFHAGLGCTLCGKEYWGATCREPCSCRAVVNGTRGPMHGNCDRQSGLCTCDASEELGYWSGTQCTVCRVGYFGDDCRQRFVVSSQIEPLSYNPPDSFIGPETMRLRWVLPDEIFPYVYVGGNVLAVFNVTTGNVPALIYIRPSFGYVNCTDLFTPFTLLDKVYFIAYPSVPCREYVAVYSLNRLGYRTFQRPGDMGQPRLAGIMEPSGEVRHTIFVSQLQFRVCAVVLETRRAKFILECFRMLPTFNGTLASSPKDPFAADLDDFFEVSGMVYSQPQDALIIFGTRLQIGVGLAPCGAYVLVNRTSGNKTVIPFESLQQQSTVVLFAGSKLASGIWCAVPLPDGRVLMAAGRISGPAFFTVAHWSSRGQRLTIIGAALPLSYRITGMTFDSDSSTAIASACDETTDFNQTCKIIKLLIVGGSTPRILGLQNIGLDYPVTAVTTRSRQPQYVSYILFSGSRNIMVRRILMWEVSRVTPTIADRKGGVTVTVIGNGFLRADRTSKQCTCVLFPKGTKTRRDKQLTVGRILSNTTALCPIPASQPRSLCDYDDVIELSLDGGISYSANGVVVRRYDTPTLKSVQPAQQGVVGVGASIKVVLVSGRGFVESPIIRCAYGSEMGNWSASTRGVYVSTTQITCQALALKDPTPPDAKLSIAIDSYSLAAPALPFVVVGRAVGLEFPLDESRKFVDSALVAKVMLRAFLVDQQRNKVLQFDAFPYAVQLTQNISDLDPAQRVALMEPGSNGSLPGAGPITHKLDGTLQSVMINGEVNFNDVFLTSPKQLPDGIALYAIVPNRPQWFPAVARIFVRSGRPYKLVIVGTTSHFVTETGDLGESPVVSVVDVGGNLLTSEVESESAVAQVVEVLPDVPLADPPADGKDRINYNKTVLFTQGSADFRPARLFARHGVTYYFRISMPRLPSVLSVNTETIVSQCVAGTFMINGLYTCSPCVPHAVCDGQNATVGAGYWRGSDLSAALYRCSSVEECPGGASAACGPKSRGPRCQLCDAGYARGITSNCEACLPNGVNIAFIALLLIGVTLLISAFVIYTVQNSDRINRVAIVMALFVSHWQTLAILPNLDNPWPSYFRTITRWIDAFADFRIMDTSFGECLLSVAGLDFTAKFVFQIVLICETFVAVGVSRAIIFMFPNVMRRAGKSDKVRSSLPMTNARLFCNSALISLFFLYQGTLFYSLGMLDCETLDYGPGDRRRLLQEDPSVDCDSASYRSTSVTAYPVAVVLIALVPASLAIVYLAHSFVRPGDRNFRYQCGAFALSGLNKSTWFWPVIVYLRKAVLVIIVVFLRFPHDAQLVSWRLIAYLVALLFTRPYAEHTNAQVEAFGIAACLVCVNLGTIYNIADDGVGIRDAIAPLIIAIESVVTMTYVLIMWTKLRVWLLTTLRVKDPLPEEEDASRFVHRDDGFFAAAARDAEMAQTSDDADDSDDDDEGGNRAAALMRHQRGSVDPSAVTVYYPTAMKAARSTADQEDAAADRSKREVFVDAPNARRHFFAKSALEMMHPALTRRASTNDAVAPATAAPLPSQTVYHPPSRAARHEAAQLKRFGVSIDKGFGAEPLFTQVEDHPAARLAARRSGGGADGLPPSRPPSAPFSL